LSFHGGAIGFKLFDAEFSCAFHSLWFFLPRPWTEAAPSLEALADGGAAAAIFASWKADAALSSEAVATVAAMMGEQQWASACAGDPAARDAAMPAVAAYVAYVVMPCPAERLVTYVAPTT
jgi:hypothetical protein